MPTDRVRSWIVTLVLTAISAVLRLQNLGIPTDGGTPIFDGKYYAAQAWQMLRNGGIEDNPGYEFTVHPPLSKQLIAVGEWLFGYNGIGWRFVPALAGVLMTVLVVRCARRMTRSTLLGGIAGVLFLCDGVAFLQSRMAMQDIFVAAFVLASFSMLLVDRDQARERLRTAVVEGWAAGSPYGPALGFRWWRLGSAVAIAMACACKWNGVFFLAAFALLTLFWDLGARRAAGVRRPLKGVLVRDLAPSFFAFAIITMLVYVACWWAWFGSETGIERHVAGGYASKGPGLTGGGIVPDALRSLWYYHVNMFEFHEHLLSPPQDKHPWESKPWVWPMSLRPMLYYYGSGPSVAGCGQAQCVRATMLIGTPAMWWLSLPMLAWAGWRTATRFDWRYATVLWCYAAGFLPWFANLARQMYFFYMTPESPFLVLGITLVLGEVLGSARAGPERSRTGLAAVALYVGLVAANFVWLWPILNGVPITPAHWNAELWIPSWH
jgi:dolichyl-phosphate-mannose--protein O-mannosyl transferase